MGSVSMLCLEKLYTRIYSDSGSSNISDPMVQLSLSLRYKLCIYTNLEWEHHKNVFSTF